MSNGDTNGELLSHSCINHMACNICGALPSAVPSLAAQEPSEAMVQAAADYMADCWTVEPHNLGADPWKGTARAILEAAFKAAPSPLAAPKYPELVKRLREVSAYADEYQLVQAAADALEKQ